MVDLKSVKGLNPEAYLSSSDDESDSYEMIELENEEGCNKGNGTKKDALIGEFGYTSGRRGGSVVAGNANGTLKTKPLFPIRMVHLLYIAVVFFCVGVLGSLYLESNLWTIDSIDLNPIQIDPMAKSYEDNAEETANINNVFMDEKVTLEPTLIDRFESENLVVDEVGESDDCVSLSDLSDCQWISHTMKLSRTPAEVDEYLAKKFGAGIRNDSLPSINDHPSYEQENAELGEGVKRSEEQDKLLIEQLKRDLEEQKKQNEELKKVIEKFEADAKFVESMEDSEEDDTEYYLMIDERIIDEREPLVFALLCSFSLPIFIFAAIDVVRNLFSAPKTTSIRHIRLTKNNEGKFGFEMQGHYVSKVIEDRSVVPHGKLRVGDKIIAVNGLKVKKMTKKQIIELIKASNIVKLDVR